MQGNNNDNNNHQAAALPAVVSGAEGDSSAMEEETSVGTTQDEAHFQADELYGDGMDEEDEAWVYKHMRGGVQETVSVINKQKQNTNQASSKKQDDKKNQSQPKQQQIKVLKPRNSDAVLSCPCCFTIVCMDCQQHERYENQYRAMFVMNIGVNWTDQYVYSAKQNMLVPKTTPNSQERPTTPPHGEPRKNYIVDPTTKKPESEEVYYSVYCNNCQTQVAALNMEDEVYHFFGCMASA